MGDFTTFGVGAQLVINLFFIGMGLGLGIKAAFELVDFFKGKFRGYMFEKAMQKWRAEQELDACLEQRELAIEVDPEVQQVEFEGQ